MRLAKGFEAVGATGAAGVAGVAFEDPNKFVEGLCEEPKRLLAGADAAGAVVGAEPKLKPVVADWDEVWPKEKGLFAGFSA